MPPEGLFVQPGLVLPEDELQLDATRAGGPGGQNVNKVASRITLRWSVAASRVLAEAQRARLLERLAHRLTRGGEVVIHAAASRSQVENRRAARERLAELLRRALVVPIERKASRPTRASRKRRLASKQRRAATKQRRQRPSQDD
ncbi:MAG TPA: alternative ribosome rescue aminoacyl-tRNA hydrolase ArfB [Planctomycetota bacterium]|nr:alternative ribosome rescue aminoacyl-tRNA hydrolase ArfB [Planctomycetota bacterium]